MLPTLLRASLIGTSSIALIVAITATSMSPTSARDPLSPQRPLAAPPPDHATLRLRESFDGVSFEADGDQLNLTLLPTFCIEPRPNEVSLGAHAMISAAGEATIILRLLSPATPRPHTAIQLALYDRHWLATRSFRPTHQRRPGFFLRPVRGTRDAIVYQIPIRLDDLARLGRSGAVIIQLSEQPERWFLPTQSRGQLAGLYRALQLEIAHRRQIPAAWVHHQIASDLDQAL